MTESKTRESRRPARRVTDQSDRAVRQIAHSLAEAEHPLVLMQGVADAALSLSRATGANIEQFAPEHGEVETIAATGRGVPPVGSRVPYPGSLTEQLIKDRGEPELLPDLTEEDRPIARLIREACGRCAALVIPLHSAVDVLGVLVALRCHGEPPFTAADADRLQLLADMTSIAFKRARLLEQTQREHERLRRSEQRERLFADAARVLGTSLDHDETLRNVARLVVPVFADWCTVDVLEGGRIRRIAFTHEDPAQEE
jgi:GAF domain-containing protein